MKMRFLPVVIVAGLFLSSCGKEKNDEIISQRYIHKYGYAVSKEEWETKNYPGQVVTTMRNGVNISSTYENGVLHGPCTHTHPHSQTVQYYYLYNQGNLVKEIVYDQLGMPIRERVQLSPSRYSLTMWYEDGTPMCVEDYAGEELLEGEYFTLNNETESRVEKGSGTRTRRTQKGVLLSKDHFQKGYLVKRETFYSTGTPESVTYYSMNKLHGEKRTFASNGAPLSIEEWNNGELHGKSTYFSGGMKQKEVSYLHNLKNGLEIHYRDGLSVEQEILWENDKKHGPSNFYIEGIATTEWYYNGKKVTKAKFDELDHLDQMISEMSSDSNQGIIR